MRQNNNLKDLDPISILILLIGFGFFVIGLPMLSVEMDKSADFRNIVLVVLGVIFIIILIIIYLYFWRKIIKYKNFISGAQSNIDVQLAKRHHLINGLLSVIKTYLQHEKNNLDSRNKKPDFNVLMEKYPDLKANNLFIELIDELSDCENEIAAAREIYNENVLQYNRTIKNFPVSLIAIINNYNPLEYWNEKDEEENFIPQNE